MAVTTQAKAEIVKKFQRGPLDTGSTEVQVALLTNRITSLSEHFKTHQKDAHGRRGLVKMVNARKSLLNYLRKSAPERYMKLISELGLRK